MTKELAVIGGWEHFRRSWEKVSTEAEAIGLLYACGSLQNNPPIVGDVEGRRLFKDKVRFLLNVFSEVGEEGRVPDTARKVIASEEILGKTYLLSRNTKEADSAGLRNSLISFFGTVHECLQRPPYPSRVQQFLYREFQAWRAAVSEAHGGDIPLEECSFHYHYQKLDDLVRALALWGSADILTFTGGIHSTFDDEKKNREISEREQARLIGHHLEVVASSLFREHKEQWLISTLGIHCLGKFKTAKDLRDEDERRSRNRLVCLALLWCRAAAAKGRESWTT